VDLSVPGSQMIAYLKFYNSTLCTSSWHKISENHHIYYKRDNRTISRSNINENLIWFYRACMEESWRREWNVVRKWNVIVWKGILFLFSVFWYSEFEWTKTTQQLTFSADRYFPLDHSSTNAAEADTSSLSLHDVDGFRVRNSRHSSHPRWFAFGKFVRKLNCSWSEAFLNRYLSVFGFAKKLR
jgi:hypothetical protein